MFRHLLTWRVGLVIAAALALAGCGGEGEGDVSTTSPTPASTPAASPSTTPTEEKPSESPTIGTTPEPGATKEESEANRALAAAEVIFGGIADPDCVPAADSPICIVPQPSLGATERGIVAFGVSDYPAGGAIVFLGRTPEGEWEFWFGTQDITYRLTALPGEMRVCAGGAGLNLRASPSTDSEALAALPDDVGVAVDSFVLTEPGMMSPTGPEAGYGWYHLTSPEEGWAYSKYLSDASLDDCSIHDIMVQD